MKVLVTGGAGFIGSHAVVELIEKGYTPIIIDDFRNSEKFIINRIETICNIKIKIYDVDCGDYLLMKNIFEIEKPDGIIHFAAYKAVNESVNKPLKYYQNNIGSLVNVLKIMETYNVSFFIFSSSCTVYGIPDKVPVTEKTPIKQAFSPYGYTKQVGEQCLRDFHKVNPHTSIILLRYFNPIGAHPSALLGELPIGIPNNLVPFVTQTAAGIREKLTVFGDTYSTVDGTCIRDYIHVVDLASSHVAALKYATENIGKLDVFNVGTGDGSSVLDVINTFEKVNNIKLNYVIGEKRDGDASCVYANNTHITDTLSWKAKYSLSDSLKHAWNWQKSLNE